MAEIELRVNGQVRTVPAALDRSLLEVLREDLQLTGTKYGCGEGSCRSCTVLLDGRAVASCQTAVTEAAGKEILTIEGLAQDGALHPLQEAFIAGHAMQCGYCVPGMIMTAAALLQSNPHPTRDQIAEWMNGNICRCCNYINIVNAIETASRIKARGVGA
jgi:aerobic-type carbon monoxide dehydrogenase small subunit (CoxS/CutS family)